MELYEPIEITFERDDLLYYKHEADSLQEIRQIKMLYVENLNSCLACINPDKFGIYSKDATALADLLNIYLSAIKKIVNTWSSTNLQNISSFIEKADSFNNYPNRYFESPSNENFNFLVTLYDSVITHSNKV